MSETFKTLVVYGTIGGYIAFSRSLDVVVEQFVRFEG